MILIVGASGTLGKVIVEDLLAKGEQVRALSRFPEKLAYLKDKGVEVVKGDLTDKASLAAACAGADKVLASAHSLFGRGKLSSAKVDYDGHLDLIDAAKAAGVKHFVYISILGADEQLPVPFIQFKRKVELYLKQQEMSYTIIRPSAFMEIHAHLLIGEPILKKGKVTIFGKGETKRNFVAVEDVAKVVVAALTDPDKYNGRVINVAGPGNYSTLDVINFYEKATNTTAKVTQVPRFVIKTMSKVLKPFHPGLSQVMAFSAYTDEHGQEYKEPADHEFAAQEVNLESWINRKVKG